MISLDTYAAIIIIGIDKIVQEEHEKYEVEDQE